jgi:CelD/BcsL family acetyltransferase involved in cellulose biosynthesis
VTQSRSEVIDPLKDPRWVGLLRGSADAGPFHHPLWLALLKAQYGYEVGAVCVAEPHGRLAAGLPFARIDSRLTGTRLVSLPFSDLCPPVVSDAARAGALDALGEALVEEHDRTGLEFEIRALLPGLSGARHGSPFLHHALALEPDAAVVESRFSKSQIRRGIKKAEREGVQVVFATDPAALDEFFRLHLETRRRQGVPTQPKRFIRRFHSLFEAGLGEVALARWRGATIAAAVFLSFNGTVIYKYGASDRRHLDKRPNNLLFVEAIRRACADGAHTFDFGRTDPDNEGLAAFKRAWGPDERELAYIRLGGRVPAEGHNGRGVPAPVKTLIWRSPPLVGQLIGAAFYRHFG